MNLNNSWNEFRKKNNCLNYQILLSLEIMYLRKLKRPSASKALKVWSNTLQQFVDKINALNWNFVWHKPRDTGVTCRIPFIYYGNYSSLFLFNSYKPKTVHFVGHCTAWGASHTLNIFLFIGNLGLITYTWNLLSLYWQFMAYNLHKIFSLFIAHNSLCDCTVTFRLPAFIHLINNKHYA